METVYMQLNKRNWGGTVCLYTEGLDNADSCAEIFTIDLENAKTLVALTHNEAISLARALLAAAGAQPGIGIRGISSADFGDDDHDTAQEAK